MISVVIITKNEEKQIHGCLESVTWADELVVLDSLSADRTVEICREYTDKVFQQPFVSFPRQRNAAKDLASGDWVFFVDADERVTPELMAEVRTAASSPEARTGYWVPRHNIIWGKWVRYGGRYPDYQLRLFRRDKAHYDEARAVHEVVILDGEAGHLE